MIYDMQKKEERRRKFHQSLLNTLYPPPPPPSPPHQEGSEVNILQDHLSVDYKSDESSSSSDVETEDCGPEKLTRAQRKRLRRKKLKESKNSRRRKIIGPLLPTHSPSVDDSLSEPQGVRPNVAEESDNGNDNPDEPAACMNPNKLKHRRMAKKLARERSKSSITENCHQDFGHCSNNENLT